MNQDEAELTIQVNTMDEVLALVNTAQKSYENLGKNACVNITQYLAGAKSLGLID